MAGQNINCPGCSERIHVPREAAAPAPAAPGELPRGERKRGGWPEADPSNVHVWLALGLGLVAMSAAVGGLHLVRESAVAEIFFSGGWVNYAEFVLFFWGLGILFLKNWKTKKQRTALLLDVLPKSVGKQITPENVGLFIAHLYKLPEHLRDSMMVNRIRKGLELFEARTSHSEVAAMMSAQSDIDANRTAGSYALLKVFLWALPILGFVGTVLGLSFAMAGFGASDLTDITALKGAVGAITSGLASAFNTTLLGLLLSMFLIFPMSAMQKREEDCLNDIDAFCHENVLPRLHGGAAAPTGSAPPPAPGGNGSAGLAELLAELTGAQRQLVSDLANVAESVQLVTKAVEVASTRLEERAAQHQQQVEESFATVLGQLASQMSKAVAASTQSADAHIGSLARGIESLNKALAKLGGAQITLQAPARRGWFSRRQS